ncbi:MAG: hypothetical protein GY833_12915 [Aestuariibacter sp.]|nr:hypothetical protein [Aestuariibacter sp.]|tara:strand:- start:148803 stop:149174 length:372 start_codon:yes stop_codon:yes gene_type:complete
MTSRASKILETHQHTLSEDAAKTYARQLSDVIPNFNHAATSQRADAGYLALALQHGLAAQLEGIKATIEELSDEYYADDVNAQRKLWLLKQVFAELDIKQSKVSSLDRLLTAAYKGDWPDDLA